MCTGTCNAGKMNYTVKMAQEEFLQTIWILQVIKKTYNTEEEPLF